MAKRVPARTLLAVNMRQHRHSCEWSQEELASVCGLHRTYIGAIERQERNVSIDNIDRIADALGLTVAELLE